MQQQSPQGQAPRSTPGQGRPAADAAPAAVRRSREEVSSIFAEHGYLAVNKLGKQLGDTLAQQGATKSQVRNILNSFQAIAETWDATAAGERERQIARLKPNLVYLAARETNQDRKRLLSGLAETLGHGIDGVLEEKLAEDERRRRYTALVDLVEAITAYHRVKARNE
jgi:CRISPR type III-A-associated protein Csm2